MATDKGDMVLNRLAVFTVTGCAVLLLGTLAALAVGGGRHVAAGAQASGYAVGATVDLPAEVVGGADRTILVFVRASCAACRRSTAVLRNLVAEASASPAVRVVLVTSSREDKVADGALVAEIGVGEEQIHRTAFDRLRLKVVPSIVVVDRTGRVIDGHVGVPDSEAVTRLLGLVKAS